MGLIPVVLTPSRSNCPSLPDNPFPGCLPIHLQGLDHKLSYFLRFPCCTWQPRASILHIETQFFSYGCCKNLKFLLRPYEIFLDLPEFPPYLIDKPLVSSMKVAATLTEASDLLMHFLQNAYYSVAPVLSIIVYP